MTDHPQQPNPYAPFVRPFELRGGGNIHSDVVDIMQYIVALLNADAQQPQSSPDLEPVRRLIEILSCSPEADAVEYDLLMSEAEGFVPDLRSLLAEVEQSRTLRKELETVSGRYGEAMQEIVRLKLEVEKLREENAKRQTLIDLYRATITKEVEEGLSHD